MHAVSIIVPGLVAGDDYVRREQAAADVKPKLCDWLCKLPKPVAILACNDVRGQQVVEACREMQIDVPGEVAVVGVDNDELTCTLTRPTLSSIEPDTRGIGYFAAGELAGMLANGTGTGTSQSIPPLRVVERESTERVPTTHPLVLEALRLIQENTRNNISAKDLCGMMNCSRPSLDSLFLGQLGRTVAEEISRVRLKLVAGLLRETPLTLTEIATHCSFPSSTHICRFIRRETGFTPNRLRRMAKSVAIQKREVRGKKKMRVSS